MPAKQNYGERPRPVKKILEAIAGHEQFDELVCGAMKTGWFTDGRIMFRFDENEKEKQIISDYAAKAKKDTEPADAAVALPKTTAAVVTYLRPIPGEHDEDGGFVERPPLVEIATLSGKKLLLEAWRYATMMDRYPKATMNLDAFSPHPERGFNYVVFTEKGKIVGMIAPYIMKDDVTPIKE